MIIGHQRIWNFLTQSAQKNRLAHAYLFVGPSQVGKKAAAIEFAKALLCEKPSGSLDSCAKCRSCVLIERGNHPDVLIVASSGQPPRENSPEDEHQEPIKNQEIKIQQIRELQHQLSLTPFSAPRKITIIDSAEQMTQEAANCLLKTLEEPPQKSLLILISSSWQKLLPTIVSRCQMINFLPVKSQIIKEGLIGLGFKNMAKITEAVKLASGRPGMAIKLLQEPASWQAQNQIIRELNNLIKKDLVAKFRYAQKLARDAPGAQKILEQWLVWFRDQMLMSLGAKNLTILNDSAGGYHLPKVFGTIKNIQEAQKLLGEGSFNARLILENLMIKL